MRNRRTQALAMFIDVSRRYPASGTAQSAAIAQKIKGDLNLLDSFLELASDYRAWRAIQRAAKIPHKKALAEGKKSTASEVVDPELITNVINGEYNLALKLSVLSQSELDEILALYPDKLGSEQRYGDYVEAHYLKGKESLFNA